MSTFRRRVLPGAVSVLFIASIVSVALIGGSERTPRAELAAIRAFVEDAKGVRFTARASSEMGDAAGDLGTTFSNRSELSGELQFPDRTHMVTDDGDYMYETIELPAGFYGRDGDSERDLRRSPWTYTDLGGGGWFGSAPDAVDVGPGMAGPLFMSTVGMAFNVSAGSLIALLDAAEEPTRVGGQTIRVTADLRDLFEAMAPEDEEGGDGGPLAEEIKGRLTATLTSDETGRLREVVTESELEFPDIFDEEPEGGDQGTATFSLDVQFFDWNGAIAVEPPDRSEIDPTPDVDEEALAAFDAAELLMPATLPAGWQLVYGDVSAGSDDDETCDEANIDFGPPTTGEHLIEDAEEEEYDEGEWMAPPGISMYFTSVDCEYEDIAGEEPFPIGPYEATADERDGEFGRTIYLTAGSTRILIESTLTDDELRQYFSQLVPFDVTRVAVARGDVPGE